MPDRPGVPVERTTPDPMADRLAQFKTLFPDVFSEGKVDLDKLRVALGETIDTRPERYSFSWAGKADAQAMLQAPLHATLAPAPDESINFDTTGHVFIEGDNLEVLRLLYKPLFGRVKLIYIDPPYNTGHDFIYPDNFTDPLDTYLRLTGQKDANGHLLTSNPETNGRYHSAWLSMMYPRLWLARQLLRDDGVIFISIDDHEVHNLRLLMNEVFGEENFIASVIWQKVYSPKSTAKHFSEDHDYIITYARNSNTWTPSLMPRTPEMEARYSNPDNDSRGPWKAGGLDARNYYSKGTYPIICPSGRVISGPPSGSYWRVSEEKFKELDNDNRIWWGRDRNSVPAIKRFLSEVKPGRVPQTLWGFREVGHTQEAKQELLDLVQFENTDNVLDTVKPTRLIQRILQVATTPDDNDIILDFFAGSAPTAHAVLKQNREDNGNRRFICVQLPEPLPAPESTLKSIADIAKMRIRQAINGLHKSNNGKFDLSNGETPEDLGFRVFKLAPSQFRPWDTEAAATADGYMTQLTLYATDPLVDSWQPLPLLWEVALKEGYSLSSRVETALIQPNHVYRITDPDSGQSCLICLDNTVDPTLPRHLRLTATTVLICRDSALNDELAVSLALLCQLKTI